MSLPEYSKYIIIGAGIHGLSTAYHLAKTLKDTGKGDGNVTHEAVLKIHEQVCNI